MINDNLAAVLNECTESVTKRNDRPDVLDAPSLAPNGAEELCRVVAALLVEGRTPVEIANVLDRREEQVRAIIRNPLTLDYVKQVSPHNQEEAVANILDANVLDTVFELIRLRDASTTPPQVKLGVCRELLDRAKGKTLSEDKKSRPSNSRLDPLESAEELEAEIKRLQEQTTRNG